jgi:phosphatidylinositol alpha 1,6-mannosyltransferase
MTQNRLLEALTRFDPQQAERIFGSERIVESFRSQEALAPIKRVAIFAEAFLPKVDGVSKTAFLTLRYLQQTGREVLIFAPDTAPHAIGSAQIIPLPSWGFPSAPETRVALPTLSVMSYLDEFKPDLIHLFSPALVSVSGMLAGHRWNLPVIANYQTDLPGYANHYGLQFLSHPARDWLRFIHNGCHLTLVPSNYTLNQLRSWGYRRLRCWGRGVDDQRFNPMQHSAEWRSRLLNGRDPHSLLCIYVGRLANEKRVDLLLEVAHTPGIALTIIGDGALRSDLETQFAGTDTYFTGYLYGDHLAQAYASADVFLFTGPCETFGQVVQEALASGLPVVVVNQGGVVDLVKDGETGFICPPEREAFASAARVLRDHPDLRQCMSRNARRFAESHPWSAIMAQLENYYCEAVSLNERFNQRYHPGGLNLPIPGFLQWGK